MKKRLVEEAKKKEKKEQGIKEEKVIGPEIFYKIDIRVGRILECEEHPDSEKLYVEKVDIGSEKRKIGSGVKGKVPIEEMSGLCIIVANLKPKRMADFDSHGMMLFAHEIGRASCRERV